MDCRDITMAVGVQFLWTCPGRRSGSWWCAQIWMILMGGMTHQRVVNKHAFTTLFDTIYDYIPHYLILYDFTWGQNPKSHKSAISQCHSCHGPFFGKGTLILIETFFVSFLLVTLHHFFCRINSRI